MSKLYIIADRQPDGTYFWNGKRWSSEYPDAQRYSKSEGTRELKRIGGPAQLIENYGLNSEKTVYTN